MAAGYGVTAVPLPAGQDHTGVQSNTAAPASSDTTLARTIRTDPGTSSDNAPALDAGALQVTFGFEEVPIDWLRSIQSAQPLKPFCMRFVWRSKLVTEILI